MVRLTTSSIAAAVGALALAACGGPDRILLTIPRDLPEDTVYRCEAGAACDAAGGNDTAAFAESATTFDLERASTACPHGLGQIMLRDLNTDHPYVLFRCLPEDAHTESMGDFGTTEGTGAAAVEEH